MSKIYEQLLQESAKIEKEIPDLCIEIYRQKSRYFYGWSFRCQESEGFFCNLEAALFDFNASSIDFLSEEVGQDFIDLTKGLIKALPHREALVKYTRELVEKIDEYMGYDDID